MIQKTFPDGTVVELANHERQECEVWSRVMGYYRPTTSWNIGKKQEFEERQMFKERDFGLK